MVDDLKALVTRIEHDGVKVLDLNIYDIALDILQQRGILDEVLASEAKRIWTRASSRNCCRVFWTLKPT